MQLADELLTVFVVTCDIIVGKECFFCLGFVTVTHYCGLLARFVVRSSSECFEFRSGHFGYACCKHSFVNS